ncbi:MAG: hypothetical protein KDI63_15560 [Gammaproteobacteria bacterium]|nr:hypothetical protein [Gammaproteobacteria bacterium]
MENNYTPQQILSIRSAIREGRRALMQSDGHPRVFASAFIRAGGLQLPGAELDRETRLRLETHIMVNVNGRESGGDETPLHRALIDREVHRIFNEADLLRAMMNPGLVGFRLVVDKTIPNWEFCERYAALDAFGLGPGVVPPHEILVLPPCCDRVRWEAVYENEDG